MKYRLFVPLVAALAFGSCAKKKELPMEAQRTQQEVQQETTPEVVPYVARPQENCLYLVDSLQGEVLEGSNHNSSLIEELEGYDYLGNPGEKVLARKKISAEVANAYAKEFDACDVVYFQKHGPAIPPEKANLYATLISLTSKEDFPLNSVDISHLLYCTPAITPSLAQKLLRVRFSGESNEPMTGEEMCTLRELESELPEEKLVGLITQYDGNFSARETITLLEEDVPFAVVNSFKELEETYDVSISAGDIINYQRRKISFAEVKAEAKREFIRRSFEEGSEDFYEEQSEDFGEEE